MNNESFIKQIEQNLRGFNNKIAVREYKGNIYTYEDLEQDIERLKLCWKSWKLLKSEKIAICGNSSYNWIVTFLAAVSDGYIAVLLPENSSEEEVQKLVNHSESSLLYYSKSLFPSMEFSKMSSLSMAVDIDSWNVSLCRIADSHTSEDFTRYDDNPCLIIYTSGTSGKIKGVVESIRNISFMVSNVTKILPYEIEKQYLSVSPFSHQMGLVYDMLAVLCLGMTLVIFGLPPIPKLLIPELKSISPSIFISVPLVIKKIVEYVYHERVEQGDLSMEGEALMSTFGHNCKMILTGGGAIPYELESFLVKKIGVPLVSGYGMTECTTISLCSSEEYKMNSCGKCLENVMIKIDSSDNGKEGELLVKSPGVFLGYYKDEALTKQSFTSDGWFKTGDICKIDEDGNVFILGRCKNVIVTSNGINVYPEEIESIINSLSFVKESLAVQREDRIVAIVRLQDGILFSQEILNRLYEVNRELPYHSMVSDFEITDSPFEKTSKGTTKRYLYGGVREK